MELLTANTIPRLPPRRPDSHKGDFGRTLLIGGSRGMSGAIALAGMAALRAGAGLVTLAVPDCCLETVAGFHPCYMTVPLPATQRGRVSQRAESVLEELATHATAVAIGPGLGRGTKLSWLVGDIYRSLSQPLVVDADGLNALADPGIGLEDAAGPRVLTPHPGEFRRLLDEEVDPSEYRDRAVELARTNSLTIVLKGHRTFVTDGERQAENTTGNPGMATGGSGDVLTGVIAALLAQGMSAYDAARFGVFVHGLAGDFAARQLGQVSLTARDLIDFLPAAFVSV